MRTGWSCPQCGGLENRGINWYRKGMFNAHSRRFDPTCATCGTRVSFWTDGSAPPPTAPVLVLSGSCASGKSTLSYLLSEHHGFIQIDGDWVLENRNAEEGRNVNF